LPILLEKIIPKQERAAMIFYNSLILINLIAISIYLFKGVNEQISVIKSIKPSKIDGAKRVKSPLFLLNHGMILA